MGFNRRQMLQGLSLGFHSILQILGLETAEEKST